MALNSLVTSALGMDAFSHSIGQVSGNIANINTVGYKSSETMFYTLLGTSAAVKGNQAGLSSSRVDTSGVGYFDRTNVDTQGMVTATGNNYDVAITGTGNAFFTLKDEFNNSYYTRAGNFNTTTSNGQVYLTASNGMKVQGFPALAGGGFGASAEDVEIKFPEGIPSTPTTEASITANVPANGVDTSSYSITTYGPGNDGKTMNMLFTKKEGAVNTWDVSFSVDGGTVTSPPVEAVFDSKGQLLTPKNIDVAVAWDEDAGGGANNINVDISNMTQLAGSAGTTNVKQDGGPSGDFQSSYITKEGIVQAMYTNGKTFDSAKLALVGFTAPNNLNSVDGTMFEADSSAGGAYYIDDTGEYIVPQALEQSTAKVEEQFSKMVVVQRAYNLNANAFTTNNEMLQTVVNLKT